MKMSTMFSSSTPPPPGPYSGSTLIHFLYSDVLAHFRYSVEKDRHIGFQREAPLGYRVFFPKG
ncbi:hypothetical protein TIFTF001_027016 [Ficus carica]|uniref:Uncharacterized protein n=1 Tax=Ficus carica TaxID=3494 RepID=A0AA88DM66_FICCA|nr:hypothetical protein TIFTF001_027016 [Ficus carica]